MLLSTGMFLFRLFCGFLPCDPVHKPPEVLSVPRSQMQMTRNLEVRITEPIVRTRAGVVEGYHDKSMNGKDFFAFQGIPFGESTGGSRRWKSPIPKRPWEGIRSAKSFGSPCSQYDGFRLMRVLGSEDCLFLNVYTPKFPQSLSVFEFDPSLRKYPVIVFLHGGAFILGGGGDYGPTYIMNEDVILVTINYRLGVMGFLGTGDEIIPGNYGLKDQALALKWVHENIPYFGGNVNNITLFGNSAGGVSTHLHLISNKTREYFSTAFSSSGTAFQHWGVQNSKNLKRLTSRLAQTFGCDSENSRSVAKCLKRIDPNFLVAAQYNLYDWLPFPVILFGPTVEPEHPDAFLTTWPVDAYKAGTVAKKPFIFGQTKSEARTLIAAFLAIGRTFPLRIMWDQVAPYYLEYNYLVKDPAILTKKITEFYLKGVSPREADLDIFEEMASDRYLNFGIVKGIQAHADSGTPTFFYHFSFEEGKHNFGNMIGMKSSEWGAGHVEDMFYFFNMSLLVDAHKQSDPDHQLSEIMIKLLVSFAETGVPTYKTESGQWYHIWEPVKNASAIRGIQFDRKVEMIDLPRAEVERLKFWSTLNLPNVTLWSPL